MITVAILGSSSIFNVAVSFAPVQNHISRPFAVLPVTTIAKNNPHGFSTKLASTNEEFFPDSCLLTPEGYGFSSPAERILRKSGRGKGYYRANGSDRVIDVMAGITEGEVDAALVFDEKTEDILGIFTESDYIKVSTNTTNKNLVIDIGFGVDLRSLSSKSHCEPYLALFVGCCLGSKIWNSSRHPVLPLPFRKKSRPLSSYPQFPITSQQLLSCYQLR